MERLVIITGASRGIGATIALETNRRFSEKTTFLLIARDESKLEEIKNKMESESSSNKIIILKFDFAAEHKKVDILNYIKSPLERSGVLKQMKELYVFYNHGTLKLGSIEAGADDSKQEFQINVISVWTLMAALRELIPLELIQTQFHINISSLLASLVIRNYSIYNTTRSARATLFRCLSVEEPRLRVLNYQPGPVYTDMQKQIYDYETEYSSYKEQYEQGKLVQPETTVKRLWEILEKNEFENGGVIDYYDKI